MSKLSKSLLLVFLTTSQLFLFSQTNSESKNIYLISRALEESIILRWAPANYDAWKDGNKYGYILTRRTVMRDTTLLNKSVGHPLTIDPIRPKPMMEWETLAKKSKYAAISCQALYGNSFVTEMPDFNVQQIRNKIDENNQRFSIALLCADYSPETAELSGLLFTDNTCLKNEMYLYKVWINYPASSGIVPDTAMLYTGNKDFRELPKPRLIEVDFGDKVFRAAWNSDLLKSVYISYDLEISENGKTFMPINDDPIIKLSKQENQEGLSWYIDSLPANDKTYYIRLRGTTSFGEKGPYSEIKQGKGRKDVSRAPTIVFHTVIDGKILLEWKFPENEEKAIDNFAILRSDNAYNGFKEIYTKSKPQERKFFDASPIPTAYYKIAIQRDGKTLGYSMPILEQLVDSIPPAQPKNMQGVVSKEGVVSLTWDANTEQDIYGYRIFRSVSGNDEYSQITHSAVPENSFTDSIQKNDLNKFIFYKIIALDHRQNQSEFSEILKLEKPDWYAPTPPVFSKTEAGTSGIVLEWIASSSPDVVKYILLRKEANEKDWKKIDEIAYSRNMAKYSYTDAGAGTDTIWLYRLHATDGAFNMSEPCESVQVKARKQKIGEGVKNLRCENNLATGMIRLYWENPSASIEKIIIYKKLNDNPYQIAATLPGNSTTFSDKSVPLGSKVYYRVKIKHSNGMVSGFSEEVGVVQ